MISAVVAPPRRIFRAPNQMPVWGVVRIERRVLAASHTGALAAAPRRPTSAPGASRSEQRASHRTPGANQPPRRRKQSHGELLLGLEFVELLQCALVLALGFLPLGVIHWADPTMKLNPARIALRVHRPRWTRTGVAAVVDHWLTDLFS